jgi:peptidoglycan/LPS O-acetylase OafA/YrhL
MSDLRYQSVQQYRPDVDGLRALAVVAVIAFHFAPGRLVAGFLGVDVFFVISGYLISGLVLTQVRAGSFSLTTFYLRRARRILPALLVMLFFVSLLALTVLMPDELKEFAEQLVASIVFVPNLALLRDVGYFDASAYAKPLLHLWSLGVEEQFYFLWPAVLAFMARRQPAARTWVAIATLAAASFVLHLFIFRESPQASFYLPFTRFWELLIGALLAAAPTTATPSDARSQTFSSAMSAVGILLIGGSMAMKPADLGPFVVVAPVLGAAMFIAAGPCAVLNRTAFSWRPVVYVGLISYPLYLWHWPLLSFLRIAQVEDRTTERLLRLLMVAIAVAAAILTYHLVESPVRRRSDLKRIGALLGIATLALGTWGLVIVEADGFPQRTSLATDPVAWSMALRNEPRCMDVYRQPADLRDETLCIRNDYRRSPRIVLLGDSHANSLWPGVLATYADFSALNIGASGCTYLRDTEFWHDDAPVTRRSCPILIGAAYSAVTPDTRLVILAARNAQYVENAAESAANFDFRSPTHFGSPDFPAARPIEVFERSLARDLSVLLESDREVVIVLQVPELNFLPRHCLRARPYERLLAKPEIHCSMPRAAVVRRQANYRAAITRVVGALADPDLHVVDPMDALCDAKECHAIIDGVLMYRDDDHLSVAGSRYVWESIRPRDLRLFARPAAP